jgi:putative ABC transport system permease protein
VAGFITGWLNVKLKIMDLLASILMMIGLYSVNLRIMGGPNVPLINDPRCSPCCSRRTLTTT